MSNILKLKGTEDTPEVLFNSETNEFKLSGRTFPEDAFKFYQPILNWMASYVKTANEDSNLIISLEYFNSSSVKQLLNLISLFEGIIATGKKAKITWCYIEGDDLMEIKGLEFKSMFTDIVFEVCSC